MVYIESHRKNNKVNMKFVRNRLNLRKRLVCADSSLLLERSKFGYTK
jgi:hypothetical protein